MTPHDPYSAGPPGGHGYPGQPPGQPPGQRYSPGPAARPSRRKRTILSIAIAVAVVVAGAGVGAYFLLSDGGGSSPRQVAQDTAEAVSSSDIAALRKLACDAGTVENEDISPGDGVKLKVEIAGDAKISGSTAEVPVNIKADYSQSPEREAGIPPTLSLKGSLKLKDGDDGWCADMTKPIGPGQPS